MVEGALTALPLFLGAHERGENAQVVRDLPYVVPRTEVADRPEGPPADGLSDSFSRFEEHDLRTRQVLLNYLREGLKGLGDAGGEAPHAPNLPRHLRPLLQAFLTKAKEERLHTGSRHATETRHFDRNSIAKHGNSEVSGYEDRHHGSRIELEGFMVLIPETRAFCLLRH